VFASNVVDRWFEIWLGQSKDYKIGACCFFTNHSVFGSKSKDLLFKTYGMKTQSISSIVIYYTLS